MNTSKQSNARTGIRGYGAICGAATLLFWPVVLLSACTPLASPTPRLTAETVQPLTPFSAEGTVFFDGCMYMVSYPPALATEDGILFQSPDDESVSVFVNASRRTDDEQGLSLDALAAQRGAQWADSSTPPSFEPVPVTDYTNNTLDGLQADFVNGEGQHVRLMIVIRPHTMLGDLLPDDVVYEIVATAPDETWAEWNPSFEIIFQNFYPKDCGGV
ncbi:MAG: hypothetical protein SXV54_10565 [Chloroflexota bacterium]|nr:hypothetical protein [Chloroflexota bacterium]